MLVLLSGCTSGSEARSASPSALSPGPLASPRPALTAGQTVYVGNTDRYGADFRQAPGSAGARIRVVPDGAVLQATGRTQQADERTWIEVRDSTGTLGWVVLDYLSTAPPPLPTPTPMPAISAPTPTPITVPPATMEATAAPRPTDTLVPLAPPRQAPALAPIPPAPTVRPDPPTLPPLAPVRPTIDVIDGDADQPPGQSGTVVPTRRPAGR